LCAYPAPKLIKLRPKKFVLQRLDLSLPRSEPEKHEIEADGSKDAGGLGDELLVATFDLERPGS
jgi:hypothetical protein